MASNKYLVAEVIIAILATTLSLFIGFFIHPALGFLHFVLWAVFLWFFHMCKNVSLDDLIDQLVDDPYIWDKEKEDYRGH